MASQVKRIQTSSVSWQKLAERLTADHSAELARLKGQNTTYTSQVSQLPADLPKVDWAALKQKLGPVHTGVLDSLQKQYEAINIPYGNIPEKMLKEIDEWVVYNNARSKFEEKKLADGAVEASEVEEKWAKAPAIENMDQEYLVRFFEKYEPEKFIDLRLNQHWIPDPLRFGYNTNEEWKKDIIWRSKNYRYRTSFHKSLADVSMH